MQDRFVYAAHPARFVSSAGTLAALDGAGLLFASPPDDCALEPAAHPLGQSPAPGAAPVETSTALAAGPRAAFELRARR